MRRREDACSSRTLLGRCGKDKVKTMIRGITDVMVGLGIPEHAVEVLIREIPKTHWGTGG